ncbi:MAG: hypothetical protein LBR12_06195 [Opitutaceae bacterium]|jgi:hypothetical protein|nr:hypothetical protein [Opitutaceae bacterium]
MEWVLEHLQDLLVVGGILAAWLLKSAAARRPSERPAETRGAGDFEADERGRRVREAVRRRIEERAGRAEEAPEEGFFGEIFAEPGMAEGEGDSVPDLPPPPPVEPRPAPLARTAPLPPADAPDAAAEGVVPPRRFRAGRLAAGGLREAVVLSEILGKPAGLRR